jgi:hypothetical protein
VHLQNPCFYGNGICSSGLNSSTEKFGVSPHIAFIGWAYFLNTTPLPFAGEW